MISVELGRSFKSFLQEIFCGGGLLVVVCNIANRIFVAYTCKHKGQICDFSHQLYVLLLSCNFCCCCCLEALQYHILDALDKCITEGWHLTVSGVLSQR